LVVRNTFIDVDEAVEQHPSHRRISAPAAFAWERSSDLRVESLSKLHLRLLNRRHEEVTDTDSCANSDVEVASSVSTQAPSTACPSSESSFDNVTSNLLMQAPCVPSGGSIVLGSWADCSQEVDQPVIGDRTTLMFRNLPEDFSRARLEQLLEAEGFATRFDFLYLPVELCSGACFGYALINMVTPSDAQAFVAHFHGFQQWPVPSTKRAEARVSEELQGLAEMIERYRNSPIMHPSVADPMRPAIYHNGCQCPFPPPTVVLKPPRAKKASRRRTLDQQQVS